MLIAGSVYIYFASFHGVFSESAFPQFVQIGKRQIRPQRLQCTPSESKHDDRITWLIGEQSCPGEADHRKIHAL
jgi:hypothetical protein